MLIPLPSDRGLVYEPVSRVSAHLFCRREWGAFQRSAWAGVQVAAAVTGPTGFARMLVSLSLQA